MELKIKYKKRSQNERLVEFILFFPFLFAIFEQLFHIPNLERYLIDICWMVLFLKMFLSKNCNISKQSKILKKWIICFLVFTAVTYLFQYQSIFYYIWGVRNNFRFYIFFFGCIAYLKIKNIESYLELLDKIFYINFIISLFQYFILGIRQDFLGGIFGVEAGCNGYLNIFQVIIISKSIIYYLNKKETLFKCVIKCSMALVIAACAELKFFFIEFIIIVILAILVTKFTWRKIVIIIATIIGVSLGISLLIHIFPNFKEVMSIQGLLESASSDKGYTSSGDMNRLTAITISNKLFLKTYIMRILGLGLGNCDHSNFDFLNTPFYKAYNLLHYDWLSTSYIYLEMGIIGLTFFFGFFVIIYLIITTRIKKNNINIVYAQLAKIIAVMCIVIGIYNSTLRTEAAYMLYFILAIPFLNNKN
ncbi:hypothetical protein ACSW93_11775 [Clostridium perfringens]